MGERTVMDTTDVSVLTRRIQELEKENARLKAILDKNGIEYESFESKTCKTNHLGATAVSTHQLTLQEKVALFQSLFQGREDVFARRWYSSTTQKSGYQPVCTREWNREFCDKRKYKCADCPNRQFAPLAYNDFFNHLAGKDAWGRDVIGLYPIRKDNTCSFLCTDFDDKSCEHGYKNDVLAFVNVCKTWNVPCYIERSRSGNGAHAWIFFDTPVTAFKARKLGNAILTEAMSCDAHLSFKSYDRFFPKQGMRLSTYNIPRIISCSEMTDDYLALPRGCEDAVSSILTQHGVKVAISDKTNHGHNINVTFRGFLREEQQNAMEAFAGHNIGTLSATTAFGKTVFAIGMLARRKVNTLILVHNKALLEQWKERLETFLKIDETIEEPAAKRGRKKNSSVIGCLYAGKNTLHGIIDIALIQSCFSDGEVKPFVKDYGMVIVDECHHVSSVSFEQVLRQVTATYVYGLTATPIRKDGHQPIIFMQCGKIRFTADAKSQMENQTFKRLLIPRFTSFRNISSDTKTYVQVTQDLSEDKVRNEFIVEDVRIAIQEGRTPLVLTTRTAHVKALAQMLIPFADHVIQLIGADSAKEKRLALQNLQSMPTSESLVIVATGKYVGEGFDYPRLDTLFLTMPIAWKGNVEQYAGRLHREYAGKNEVRIYDYVDVHVPLCDSMYRKRLKGYLRAGYGKYVTSFTLDKNPQELIYERNNYEAIFRNDLAKAQYSVIIAVPKIKFKYKPVIMSTLANIIHNGVTVAVHIKEEGANEIELKNTGMDVVCNMEQTLQCAIIDKSIVWYGNINFFGYNSETNNVIRIADHKIANEMIEILYSDTGNDANGG